MSKAHSPEAEVEDRVPIAATDNRPVDYIDVSGWSVFKCHAIPVDVARFIAEKINLYHEYRLATAFATRTRSETDNG